MEIAAVFGAILVICYLIRLVKPLGDQVVVSSKRAAADARVDSKCPRCGQTFYFLLKDGKMMPEVNACRWCGQSFLLPGEKPH